VLRDVFRRKTLQNPIDLIRKPENALENMAGNTGKLESSKMKGALDKRNTGYKAISSISRVLMGEGFSIAEIRQELTSIQLGSYRFCGCGNKFFFLQNTRTCWPSTDIHLP
jgi:hypothetical protein